MGVQKMQIGPCFVGIVAHSVGSCCCYCCGDGCIGFVIVVVAVYHDCYASDVVWCRVAVRGGVAQR